jgi:hypothetical protein
MLRLYVHCLSYWQSFHWEVYSIITQTRISSSFHIVSGMAWNCSTFSISATNSSSDILRALQFCDWRFQQRHCLFLRTVSFYTKILQITFLIRTIQEAPSTLRTVWTISVSWW